MNYIVELETGEIGEITSYKGSPKIGEIEEIKIYYQVNGFDFYKKEIGRIKKIIEEKKEFLTDIITTDDGEIFKQNSKGTWFINGYPVLEEEVIDRLKKYPSIIRKHFPMYAIKIIDQI